MQSSVVKRSIVLAGHKTSVSLEDDFWRMLKEIAKEHDLTLSELVAKIDSERQLGNLSSAIRLFVLGLCAKKFKNTRPLTERERYWQTLSPQPRLSRIIERTCHRSR